MREIEWRRSGTKEMTESFSGSTVQCQYGSMEKLRRDTKGSQIASFSSPKVDIVKRPI